MGVCSEGPTLVVISTCSCATDGNVDAPPLELEFDPESADDADFAASVACFPIVVISLRNWSMKYCPAHIPRMIVTSKMKLMVLCFVKPFKSPKSWLSIMPANPNSVTASVEATR